MARRSSTTTRNRYGTVHALSLDQGSSCASAASADSEFSTQIVDVVRRPAPRRRAWRSGKEPIAWLGSKSKSWRDGIAYATLDLSGPYRAVFHQMLPEAVQVADPFHVVRLANSKLDECRRRVQNATIGHRGHKPDPLYRCRRLLTKADERLEEHGRDQAARPLACGRSRGRGDHRLTREGGGPRALRAHERRARPRVGGTPRRGHGRFRQPDRGPLARQDAPALDAPDRRVASSTGHQRTDRGGEQLDQAGEARGLRLHSFRNYRVRSLLYTGRPNWAPARDDHTPVLKTHVPDSSESTSVSAASGTTPAAIAATWD